MDLVQLFSYFAVIVSALTSIWLLQNENIKLQLNKRPKFWLNGAMSLDHKGQLQILLDNAGGEAIIKSYKLISGEVIIVNNLLPFCLQKDNEISILLICGTVNRISLLPYEFEIRYEDQLKNEYISKVIGIGNEVKIIT